MKSCLNQIAGKLFSYLLTLTLCGKALAYVLSRDKWFSMLILSSHTVLGKMTNNDKHQACPCSQSFEWNILLKYCWNRNAEMYQYLFIHLKKKKKSYSGLFEPKLQVISYFRSRQITFLTSRLENLLMSFSMHLIVLALISPNGLQIDSEKKSIKSSTCHTKRCI